MKRLTRQEFLTPEEAEEYFKKAGEEEEDFFTSGEGPGIAHRDPEVFKAASREGNCRAAIYHEVKIANGEIVFARDMELKYFGIYKSSVIYRAVRDLVRSGLVKRRDAYRDEKLCIGLVIANPWKAIPAEYISQPKIYERRAKKNR